MEQIVATQEEIHGKLTPAADTGAGVGSFTIFLSGLVLGIVMGLFFASYLVKMGRLGAKRGSKPVPPPKEFT